MEKKIQSLVKIKNPKMILVTIAAIFAISYVGGLSYLKYIKDQSRTIKAEIIHFKNIPENVIVKATLKNKSGYYDLAFENSTLILPQKAIDNFTVPYIIESRWQNDAGEYRDIKWELDNRGIKYDISIDGFKPKDSFFVTINDSLKSDTYMMDWSGRFLMNVVLIETLDMRVCSSIQGSFPLNFCQFFPARKKG